MKWTEEQLTKAMIPIAAMCATGQITWDQKEKALTDILKLSGWTRGELQELNRRKNAHNN